VLQEPLGLLARVVEDSQAAQAFGNGVQGLRGERACTRSIRRLLGRQL
jgi:hypothetical protein